MSSRANGSPLRCFPQCDSNGNSLRITRRESESDSKVDFYSYAKPLRQSSGQNGSNEYEWSAINTTAGSSSGVKVGYRNKALRTTSKSEVSKQINEVPNFDDSRPTRNQIPRKYEVNSFKKPVYKEKPIP